MLSKHLAKHLLATWAQGERREMQKVDYPPVSPMFKDYVSGYRSLDVSIRAEETSEKVGRALAEMHQGLARTLRRVYLDRERCSRKAHDIALDGFCRKYESLEDAPD